jgi:hypothetical protein
VSASIVFADLQDFGVRKILHTAAVIDAQLVGDLGAALRPIP